MTRLLAVFYVLAVMGTGYLVGVVGIDAVRQWVDSIGGF
jgi:hypothetical protein